MIKLEGYQNPENTTVKNSQESDRFVSKKEMEGPAEVRRNMKRSLVLQ